MNPISAAPARIGDIHFIHPTGTHKATIVWLHGLADDGAEVVKRIRNRLSLPNANPENVMFQNFILEHVKFICPTAEERDVDGFPGKPFRAWFNVKGLGDPFEDMEGLEASAAYAIYLLSTEPSNVKLGIGGVGMGACVALYSATSFVLERYANGSAFPPININFIFSLSGDLLEPRDMDTEITSSDTAAQKAAKLPLLICHGKNDDEVPLKKAMQNVISLYAAGFRGLVFRPIEGMDHYPNLGGYGTLWQFLSSNI